MVNLEPCEALSLVNTDLEVDLLPSERAQHEQEKRARAEEQTALAALAVAQQAGMRAERAEITRSSLPEEVPADTPSSVLLLVRLPQGKSERFCMSCFSFCFDIVPVQVDSVRGGFFIQICCQLCSHGWAVKEQWWRVGWMIRV